ncbi:MAG: phosphoglycerate kinase, partial [Candidatus Portnoybacteria bacterium]|nr:phosphoglycerate kinase [Candidatus Portnoybacteria bacterium]
VLGAKGLAIGKSLIEENIFPEVKKMEITNPKLHIPVDVILSEDKNGQAENRVGPVGKIGDQELIWDIGPETIEIFEAIIRKSKTVVWNGPMGYFETEEFGRGTKKIAEIIASADCYSVVGGGETTCLLEKMGIIEKFSHVSTGGGAMLEFLSGDKLPGIAVLD